MGPEPTSGDGTPPLSTDREAAEAFAKHLAAAVGLRLTVDDPGAFAIEALAQLRSGRFGKLPITTRVSI